MLCDDVRSMLHVPIHGRFANRPYILRSRDTRISESDRTYAVGYKQGHVSVEGVCNTPYKGLI